MGNLPIDYLRARDDARPAQAADEIPCRHLAAQMKARPAYSIGDHPLTKGTNVPTRIVYRKPQRGGDARGGGTDRVTGQVATRAQPAEGLDPVDRGKDKRARVTKIERMIQIRDPDQRRDHDQHLASPLRAQLIGQTVCLGLGPGDQYGGGHGGSAVVCTPVRCYLPIHDHATGTPMAKPLTVLGLESSCDDTAAAVLRVTVRSEILSSVVYGQDILHRSFGGIVPEIAARAHAEQLDLCVKEALAEAKTSLGDVDLVAVTAGPGLIGGVLSGVMCAKGIAAGADLPLVGVNHLAGHALTPRLTDHLDYPYLVLLVSGGHCQFLIVRGCDDFSRLGGTIDDAPGEAFDKVARLLGLGQPGGPAVEAEAQSGDETRFALPRPLLDRAGCDLSFSGLKTAVLRARDELVSRQGGLTRADRADLCAGFQAAVSDVLAEKSRRALAQYLAEIPKTSAFAVAGGVAANQRIRTALETVCNAHATRFIAPPHALCTDNAAMIAHAGAELYRSGYRDDMSLGARPRWPLDRTSPALLGSGKKGAKA